MSQENAPIAVVVKHAAWSAVKLLRRARETLALEREYAAADVADHIAYLLDGQFCDPLSAKVAAESDGEKVVVSMCHHDALFDRTSSVAQVFVVTVAPMVRTSDAGPGPSLMTDGTAPKGNDG